MLTAELDYDLPPERIATTPIEPRDQAKLMVVRRKGADRAASIEHRRVADLAALGVVGPGDLMVVNRTGVLPAYFEAKRVATGGRVRGLYLASESGTTWRVMLESGGTLRTGEKLAMEEPDSAEQAGALTVGESLGRGRWRVEVDSGYAGLSLLERVGKTPLPPYIRRARLRLDQPEVTLADRQRYNTVYADEAGSVAAPTAGLHFTPDLLRRIEASGVRLASVVLRIGQGTFEPIRTDNLADHAMHREWLHVPPQTIAAIGETRAAGGRILAIGTTTVRALESLPEADLFVDPAVAGSGYTTQTSLFIRPDTDFTFRFTDALLTNFHLPRSTLLALVAALPGVGLDRLKQWYRIAVDQEYRFYSYGDAILIA